MPPHYPPFVVITHLLNILFLLMLGRSGLEVLSAHPKLYWTDDCPPGRQWARFGGAEFGAESRPPWTSQDEEVSWNPVVALPGRKNLGIGRHWHFLTLQFWIATGAVYVVLLFTSGYWRYLVPTDPAVVAHAIRDIGTYLQFTLPEPLHGEPFNAAQKLAYFAVVFLLAPLQIATGAAMSPAVIGRFPWYAKLFGGRQGARSLHFIGLVAFTGFIVVHTALVVVHGLLRGLAKILLGGADADHSTAVILGTLALVAIIVLQVVFTAVSLRFPRRTAQVLGARDLTARPEPLVLHSRNNCGKTSAGEYSSRPETQGDRRGRPHLPPELARTAPADRHRPAGARRGGAVAAHRRAGAAHGGGRPRRQVDLPVLRGRLRAGRPCHRREGDPDRG